jgi:hypothetical protein
MSTTVTETAEYANTTLPDRPQDGEVIYMDAGAAPQWPLWQRPFNRTAHHEAALAAHLSWNGDFAVDPGGSNSSFTVRIGGITAVNLYGASASKVLAYAGGTIGASKILGGGNLTNSTWYYVYAWNNAGTLDFEISTTAPDGPRATKSGDATRRYLGCFPTTSAGAPIPLRASRGRYVYRHSGSAAADTRVLTGGSATSNTAVECAALVPPHSRLAKIRAQLTSTAAAFNYAYLRTEGDSGADEHMIPLPNINVADAVYVADIETDADQDIAYRVTNNSGAPTLTLWVAGFYE